MARIARLPHFAGVILACGCLIALLGFGPRSGTCGFLLTPMSSGDTAGAATSSRSALALQNAAVGRGPALCGCDGGSVWRRAA